MSIDFNLFSRLANAVNIEAYDTVLVDISLYIADLSTIEWELLSEEFPIFFAKSSANLKHFVSYCYQDTLDLYELLIGRKTNKDIDRSNVFDAVGFLNKLRAKGDGNVAESDLTDYATGQRSGTYNYSYYKALIQVSKQLVRIILHPEQNVRDQRYLALNLLSRLDVLNKNEDIESGKLIKMIKKEYNQTDQYYYPKRLLNYLPCEYPKWLIHEGAMYRMESTPFIQSYLHGDVLSQGDSINLESNFISMSELSTSVADFALFLLIQDLAIEKSQYCFYAGNKTEADALKLINSGYYEKVDIWNDDTYTHLIALIYMFHKQFGQTSDPMDYDLTKLNLETLKLDSDAQKITIRSIYEKIDILKGVN